MNDYDVGSAMFIGWFVLMLVAAAVYFMAGQKHSEAMGQVRTEPRFSTASCATQLVSTALVIVALAIVAGGIVWLNAIPCPGCGS